MIKDLTPATAAPPTTKYPLEEYIIYSALA